MISLDAAFLTLHKKCSRIEPHIQIEWAGIGSRLHLQFELNTCLNLVFIHRAQSAELSHSEASKHFHTSTWTILFYCHHNSSNYFLFCSCNRVQSNAASSQTLKILTHQEQRQNNLHTFKTNSVSGSIQTGSKCLWSQFDGAVLQSAQWT